MRRIAAASAILGVTIGAGVLYASSTPVDTSGEWQIVHNGEVVANIDWVTAPATTEAPPSSTTASSSVAPETTTTSSSLAPTTSAAASTSTLPATTSTVPPSSSTTTSTTTSTPPSPTTTQPPPPSGVQFVETFDTAAGLDHFNRAVWHRDPHNITQTQWQGDHADLGEHVCGNPTSGRTVRRNAPAGSFYVCESVDGNPAASGHLMTSVGDTSGYSIAWFSPNQVFPSVTEVSFDVNLTNLGGRKWWKVGVVSDATYNSRYANFYGGEIVPGFLVSDVGSAALRTSLQNSGLLIATWSGQASAGWPGGYFKIGNGGSACCANPAPTDKGARFPVSLKDNGNGTITFTVAGASTTRTAAFPACPCRVVFYDHNYTPNKSDPPAAVTPFYTWHWDNVIVR